MNKQDKIAVKQNWKMCKSGRVTIHNATYREALSYRVYLIGRGATDIANKPLAA